MACIVISNSVPRINLVRSLCNNFFQTEYIWSRENPAIPRRYSDREGLNHEQFQL